MGSGDTDRAAGFNPRARVGRDASPSIRRPPFLMFQSTRPRGARRTSQVMIGSPWGFQSTRPRGARPKPREFDTRLPMFQSTRPRGARLKLIPMEWSEDGFNPRARVGRDFVSNISAVCGLVSIHAPAWGATAAYPAAMEIAIVSIHAPAWGATTVKRELK